MLQAEAVNCQSHLLLLWVMKPISKLHRSFGSRIKELRLKQSMTQEKLAELIEVDRSYMGFIERGERNPTLEKMRKIAKALKVNVKDIFDFEK